MSKDYLNSLYKGNVSLRESLFFIKDKNGKAGAGLLHECDKVLKMENLSGNKIWKENIDFYVENNRVILTENSTITKFEMDFSQLEEPYTEQGYKNINGGYLYFTPGGLMQLDQVFITYEIKKRTPVFCHEKSTRLKRSQKLISQGSDITILVYGDSISAGGDSSGTSGLEPFMPNWAEQIKELIELESESNVNLINTSVGGMNSTWGAENFEENVLRHNPDLLIIGFGMNDGTGRMPHKEFSNNIKTMIDKTKNDIDIILISTMLPNPQSATDKGEGFLGYQKEYRPHLKSLLGSRVELFDMTAVHESLLEHKKNEDLLGNNINHPNDYLARWYAQGLFKLL